MKKSDLKDGMQVQYREGCVRVVKGEYLLNNQGVEMCYLIHYNDNLTHIAVSDLDIVKVYELKELWQRKELTEQDIEVLKSIKVLYPNMNWVARDLNGRLFLHIFEPVKMTRTWGNINGLDTINKDFLPFIKWEDEQPYNIDELLKEIK